jgi:hypothetical protein
MTPSRPHILLIADVPNWIFHRHTEVLERFLSDEFTFSVLFRGQSYDEDDYDLIYPLEFDMVKGEDIVSPMKYITGIRSHASWADMDFLPFVNFLSDKFKRVHVVSKRLMNIFSPFLTGVCYVTHGVDTQFFTPTRSADQSGKTLRLGWSGNRKNLYKGFKEFILPLGKLSGVELVYCGYADRILSLKEMPAFYDSIDAYICTSIYEGSNNSLLETASMERAIITTDNGTVPEYLVHEESALIVPREQTAFINAVERLRDNPDLRAWLGCNARRSIIEGGWDWKNKVIEYRNFFWGSLEDNKDISRIPELVEDLSEFQVSVLLEIVHSQWEIERELHMRLSERMLNMSEGEDFIAALEEKIAYLEELEGSQSLLLKRLEEKDKRIEEFEDSQGLLLMRFKEKDKRIEELEDSRELFLRRIEEKEKWIEELEDSRNLFLMDIEKKKNWIEKQETTIEEQGRKIEEQGRTIEEQGRTIEEQGKTIEEQERFRNNLENSRGYRLLIRFQTSHFISRLIEVWQRMESTCLKLFKYR